MSLTSFGAKRKSVFRLSCSRPGLALSWIIRWRCKGVFLWFLAADHFIKREYFLASTFYKLGLEKYPQHADAGLARVDYANCLYRLGQVEAAIEAVSPVVQNSQPIESGYLLLGKLLRQVGRRQDALRVLLRACRLFPERVIVYSELMFVAAGSGVSRDNLESLADRIIRLRAQGSLEFSEEQFVAAALARYELRIGRQVRARHCLELANKPEYATPQELCVRAELAYENGDLASARANLANAISMDPFHSESLYQLAKVYLDAGKANWAVELASTACKCSLWRNPRYLRGLQRAYEETDCWEVAELMRARASLLDSTAKLRLELVHAAGSSVELLRKL